MNLKSFHDDLSFDDSVQVSDSGRRAGRGGGGFFGRAGAQKFTLAWNLRPLICAKNPIIQSKEGVDAAPSALIAAGLLTQLQNELGYKLFHDATVHSYSSLEPSSDPDYRNMKRPLAVSAVTKRISEQVYEHAQQGRFVLTLGGDHSIAIGTVAGTAQATRERLGREMAVIWVDAHADINTPEASPSGNIHGMPVAFLTGLAEEKRQDVFGWLTAEQKISLKKLVYIGLRDVDIGEKRILKEHGIKAFSMHDIDRYGGAHYAWDGRSC